MSPRFSLAIAVLLVLAPVARAQTPASAPADFHAPVMVAPASGSSSTPGSLLAYPCDPALNSATRRCASTATPGTFTALQAPQFFLLTVDDCMTPATEALVRSLLDNTIRNPDGRPVPVTYFLMPATDRWRCPNLTGTGQAGVSDPATIRDRYNKGDEIAVHTQTHTTFDTTRAATWRAEIDSSRAYFQRIGLTRSDVGRGFRAPRIATNPAMFDVLKEKGFLYDSSIFDTPYFSQVTAGPGQFVWPYTFDVWGATWGERAHRCEEFQIYNVCATTPKPGLWEIPLYEYKATADPQVNDYIGAFDMGNPVYNPGPPSNPNAFALPPAQLEAVFNDYFNARYNGNRAPMNFYFHPPTMGDPNLQPVYKSILRAALSRGDVWAVTMQGLIEWMQAPVPASGMKAWYNSYCTRHNCQNPVAAEAAPVLQDAPALRLYPNPTTGSASAEVTTTAPGATVRVHDVLGREVLRVAVPGTGAQIVPLDLSGTAPGVYVIVVEDGGRVQTQRLVRR